MEEWKDIKGYDGRYQVSNLGRVKSIWHEQSVGIGQRRLKRIDKERMVAITDNGKGYKLVSLSKNGKRKNEYVHRLVAEYFLDKKDGANVVNHKDCNPSNNKASNLEWCSQQENIDYSVSFGRGYRKPRKTSSGENYIQTNKYGTYSVVIRRKQKQFKNLDEAIAYRDMILKGEADV